MREQDSTAVSIYALMDPDTGEVKYIGQTRVDPEERVEAHMGSALSTTSARGEWFRSLRERGVRPAVRVLEVVASEQGDEAERGHIVAHVQRGCVLMNCARNRARNPPRHQPRPRWSWHGTVTLREEVGAEVERLAHQNGYPVSLMPRTLVREVLAARAAPVPAAPAPEQEG